VIKTVAGRLGMNPETLHKWIGPGEIDAGARDGTRTASAREIRELKRKNAELERTIESLTAATSCFVRGAGRRRSGPGETPRSPRSRLVRTSLTRTGTANPNYVRVAKMWAHLRREGISVAECTVERVIREYVWGV
jgi:transposase-like protein